MKRFPACILATRCIPWDEHGQFLESVFRRGVRATLAEGTRHLYVFGTAGEGYAVTDRQFEQIVAVFADEMRRGNAEPMVGIIELSLGALCERIERSRACGIRLFQISLPSWGAVSDAELLVYFDRVCGRFDDCQFLHYNLPRTKRLLSGEEYSRLADRYPNLVATKNCGDSLAHLQNLLEQAPQLQHFLSESGYIYGSRFAECGLLASFTMSWPKIRAIFEAGQRRDSAALATLQQEVNIVRKSLFGSVPEGRMDGAYDKLFEKMHDPEFPLRLLPPYAGSSDAEFQAFVQSLSERLPDWIPVPKKY